MESLWQIISGIFQVAFLIFTCWFVYKVAVGLVAGESLRLQKKSPQKSGTVAIVSEKIPKTPQEEVAEAVRFALRVGVTPEQIKEIVVKEVLQIQN